ncbi:dTMP kinase [Acididesulfobacillus acetoxydans]|uniref:Thymidylate kinase n=1 Tax=Acididesulfobacillus acetoxydans TaxID=1561005 RepID=A0A8S0XWQ5_9FIRM|nr:dTMP kinase [Acididesulfobacillus acetoxydans]CAA7601187.1 dTMP kinase [Acididesulfobacillus acetoxydans]CEJ08534.1 Thymidylate kinase [Acididesulfobacillus acetoxydans]
MTFKARGGQMRGHFIVLEGIDGSGLTTQAALTARWLEKFNRRAVLVTKEPSDGPVGSLIRQALSKRLGGLGGAELALLFAADRLDHLAQQIRPALALGGDVVCDRYLWSSLAYQGLELPREWLESVNEKAMAPDLTLFIRVDPKITLSRIEKSRLRKELFEQETTLQQVLRNFDDLAQRALGRGENAAIIDGNQPVDRVAAAIRAELARFVRKPAG